MTVFVLLNRLFVPEEEVSPGTLALQAWMCVVKHLSVSGEEHSQALCLEGFCQAIKITAKSQQPFHRVEETSRARRQAALEETGPRVFEDMV